MKFKKWIRTRHKIPVTPAKKVWGLFFYKRVPVRMVDLPVSVWMRLQNVVFDITAAPYILSVYLGINPGQVEQMQAGRVIALFNHIKKQTEKCNTIWINTQSILLQIPDKIDRSHWEGKELIRTIYDLAKGDVLKSDEIENITFSKFINWMTVEFCYIRDEQNLYMKNKKK